MSLAIRAFSASGGIHVGVPPFSIHSRGSMSPWSIAVATSTRYACWVASSNMMFGGLMSPMTTSCTVPATLQQSPNTATHAAGLSPTYQFSADDQCWQDASGDGLHVCCIQALASALEGQPPQVGAWKGRHLEKAGVLQVHNRKRSRHDARWRERGKHFCLESMLRCEVGEVKGWWPDLGGLPGHRLTSSCAALCVLELVFIAFTTLPVV
jgi:hypothetical protein